MTRRLGQVGRFIGRSILGGVSFLLRLAMLLVLVAGVGAAALGWRLAQGPLAVPSIPGVNRLVAERLAGLAPGLEFSWGQALLAWKGWADGAPQPLELRLDGLRAKDGAGSTRASLGSLEASVALPPLMRGVVAPVRVVLREPVALLRRDMGGALSLDLGISSGPLDTAEPGVAAPEEGVRAGTDALAQMLRGDDPNSPFTTLRELRVENGVVQVRDDPLRLAWAIHEVSLLLTRGEDGAVAMRGSGGLRLAGQEIPVRIVGRTAGSPLVAEASLEIESVSPPALATALPSLQPLAALEAELGARFQGRYDFGNGDFGGRVEVRSSPGRIAAGERSTPFEQAELVLTGDGRRIAVERFALVLPPGAPGRPSAHVTLSGGADRQGERWKGRVELGIDAIAVPDLRIYWPPGLAEGGRRWITENLTTGLARDGRWFAEGEAAADFSDAQVTDAGGTLRAEGLTVHWLRPVPPLEGVDGTVTFSMKEIVIQARAARQSGTALAVPEARIRIFDLGVPLPDVEKADIEGRITGPFADAIALVRHPRLHLAEKVPVRPEQLGGTQETRLTITALPLLNDLPIDELKLETRTRITNGRVANVAEGLSVERAQLDVGLTVDGMTVAGTARLGPVPARLKAELDFRSGPPSQVTERVQVEGRATAADLARFGVDVSPYLGGAFGFSVQGERQRSKTVRATVAADLREARIALKPFDYAKPAGAPARAEAVVRLRGEDLEAVEGLRIEGPDLSVRGGVNFRPGGAFGGAELLEARIGPSRLAGRVVSPGASGEPWDVRVRGTLLDAEGLLRDLGGGDEKGRSSGRDAGSTPLRVDAAIDRVRLGGGRELAPVRALLFRDARGVIREAALSARGVRGGGIEAAVVPRGAGRAMEARAEGLGTLLRDLGVFDAVDGGNFHASGTWSGNEPNSPLTGVAELRDFGVREAASIGKFLQALSIYGIPEAVRGPGLRFTVASAPFTYTPQALTLTDARAVSASLGFTVGGRVLLEAERIDLRGTIVPSYAVNSALGRIPGIGQLFTAERNGGLFAANFRVTGKMDDPDLQLDPLSLLAPGALRGLLPGAQER
ncbi:AsmA-like C-terminal region-containing protein [Roseomonas populi]|uniref:AsmA-like C-terminal region-containing protein n=1 Tax=Roseomonas populi TaxID=3121582 RepID=A0ABT1X222_9PROT|nr:AsmA-like C-terminal region-containing protein [Roseomonas pecuniae]MCR0982132.1 AsmA-like C-terminal region-containing protein [Roseomonas pecuniae]